MSPGQGLLIAGGLGVVLVLWSVGARRRIRRLRLRACKAFAVLEGILDGQHRWITEWCQGASADQPPASPADAWRFRLTASVNQAALALRRLRRDPLDAAAMAGLCQARRALHAVLLAGADHAEAMAPEAAPVDAWPPVDWTRLVHQEMPLAAAFNERVAAYNAAVSQFPALLLAALLRHRKARGMDVLEPG